MFVLVEQVNTAQNGISRLNFPNNKPSSSSAPSTIGSIDGAKWRETNLFGFGDFHEDRP